MATTAEEMRLTGYSRPASEVISAQEQKFSDYALPAARLSMAAPKEDKFLQETIEQNRIRRSMGGMSTGSYGPDMDYLNSPPLRDRWEGERESDNTIDARESGRVWQFASLFPMTMNQGAAKWYDPAVEAGVVNRPFYPEPTGREPGQFVYNIALEIANSMKRLKDGIPEVKDFSPQDVMNVAGIAMTGGFGAAATREGVSLGSAGGRLKTDPAQFPKQGVLPIDEKQARLIVGDTMIQRARNPNADPTAPFPQGVDPSLVVRYDRLPKGDVAKIERKITEKANTLVSEIKEELPDLTVVTEKSGSSQYVYVKDGDKTLGKFRVGDHAATSQDTISIDPVSGNTIETILGILKYEKGLVDTPPQIGWSYLPPDPFRKAVNRDAGMNLFPEGRQIGGMAEYLKGGYSSSQQPYRVVEQTVGTDIQWQAPKKVSGQ